MKFEYTLQEEDYLSFQLYTAQQRPRFYLRQKNGRFFLAMIFATMGIYFGYSKEWGMVAYFSLLTIVIFLFYPRYFRWRQKMHYLRFVRQHYRSAFNAVETFERSGKTVKLSNQTGEGILPQDELESWVETGQHFYILLKSSSGLVIPKAQVEEDAFRKELMALNLSHTEHLNWKW